MFETIGTIVIVYCILRLLWRVPMPWLARSYQDTLGSCVVITGATDGIGKAYAFECVKRKVENLILFGRSDERLRDLEICLKELKTNTKIETVVHDFGNDEKMDEVTAMLKSKPVSCLIHSVGLSYPGAQYFHEIPLSFIDSLLNVNVASAVVCTQAVFGGMKKRNSGSIVLMGSGASVASEPLLVGYAACKGALAYLGKCLNADVVRSKVGVQTQMPFMVTSKMSKIRNPSILVPSSTTYAQWGLETLRSANNTTFLTNRNPLVSPYPVHAIVTELLSIVPQYIWERFRLSEQKVLRKKYMAKVQRMAVNQI